MLGGVGGILVLIKFNHISILIDGLSFSVRQEHLKCIRTDSAKSGALVNSYANVGLIKPMEPTLKNMVDKRVLTSKPNYEVFNGTGFPKI